MSTQIYWQGNLRVMKEKFYTFEELSPEAQENAWKHHWINGERNPYPWSRENEESLEEFCATFGVSNREWAYGGYQAPWIKFSIPEADDLYGLKGIRLWKYLKANFDHVFKDMYPFTGYYIDEELLKPLRAFLELPDTFTTMEDLVQDALNSWVHACNEDFENYYSEEYFAEQATELGWLFTEDGSEIEYDRDGHLEGS